MVLLIHTNSFYVKKILNSNSYITSGVLVNLLDTIIWAAVPIFIFISGYKYYIFEKNIKYNIYLKKKILKVIKPFIVLTIISIIYNEGKKLTISIFFKDLIKSFLGNNFAYQLWYIPMYIFIIATYSIICKLIVGDKKRFFILSIISILTIILGINKYPFKFIYYWIFFELGVQMAKNKLNKYFKEKYLNIFLVFLVFIALNIKDENISIIYKSLIINPFMVIFWYSISLKIKNNKLMAFLGSYSFYIFIIHEPFLNTKICEFVKLNNLYSNFFIQFIIAIIVCLTSIGITIFINKNKLLKRCIF